MVYVNLFGNLGNLLFQYGTAVSLGGGRAVGVTRDPKTLAQLKAYAEVFRGLETVPEPPAGARKVEQVRCDHTSFRTPARATFSSAATSRARATSTRISSTDS